jgi:hypothetical protein
MGNTSMSTYYLIKCGNNVKWEFPKRGQAPFAVMEEWNSEKMERQSVNGLQVTSYRLTPSDLRLAVFGGNKDWGLRIEVKGRRFEPTIYAKRW